MLSEEAFDQWYWQLGLIDQAKTVITNICTSNPSRRVQGSAGNVSGTYPSLKMGFAIQFESHKEALGVVVAQLPSIQSSSKRGHIRLVINHAVEKVTSGNIAAFARFLDLSRNTVENWCQDKRIPEMDMLLRLCYRLNLFLDEVLFQEAEVLRPRLQDLIPEARFQSRRRTAIDKERIFHLLEQAANSTEDPPPSLQEVGQRFGYQPTTLYKINRAACHAIAEHFTAYRCQIREKRLQGYREEIRQIALLLQAEKVALTRKHIARYLAQPAILRDPKVRDLLQEVCREVQEHS